MSPTAIDTFSFLTYIAVLYLAALREVRIRGAYYGLLRDGLSPFLDLRPLLELPRWLHALEVLRDTGSTLPMAKAIGSGPQDAFAKKIVSDLSQFSDAYLSGLPLELGRQAHGIRNQSRKPLKKRLEQAHRLPLAGEMVDRLAAILEPFALTESASGSGWKRQITLSEEELKRQARVIDDLLNRESFATRSRSHERVGRILGRMAPLRHERVVGLSDSSPQRGRSTRGYRCRRERRRTGPRSD